jgi:hypothetical protein
MSIVYNDMGERRKKPPINDTSYSYRDSQEVSWPLSVQSVWRVQRVVRRRKSLS